MDTELVAGAAAGAGAANAEPPNPIHGVLTTCGITTAAHRDVFINVEGLNSIGAFTTMNGDTDVTEMAKRMASRPNAAAGRVIIGTMQIKRVQALVFWVKDFDRRGMEAAPELWTDDVMSAAMYTRNLLSTTMEKSTSILLTLASARPTMVGTTGSLPLLTNSKVPWGLRGSLSIISRVLSGWDDDDELFLTDDEKRRYEMPLQGENFKHDNKLVFQMLKSACIKSDAWAWIRSFDRAADGRKAWLALVEHYDGSGELSKRVERAKAELERLHYMDEKVFPFEKFITKLKENFNVLEKDKHEDLSGRQLVDLMTKAIRSTDARILAGSSEGGFW
jgi:hypothetical protein